MRRRLSVPRRVVLLALLCRIASAASVAAQNPPVHASATAPGDQRYRYRLLGVYDEATGEPIAGVEVRDVLSGLSASTTTSGTVSLIFLPDGGGLVRLRKVGYELETLMIAISPANTAPVTLTLRRAAQLPTVVVNDSAPTYLSPRLRQVEGRLKSHAGGYFIDESTMRRWDNSVLGDAIISRVPGVYSTTGPHGEMYLLSARIACSGPALSCQRSNCYVKVYVDGVPFASSAVLDFSQLSPQDYAIAEFYPGGASVPVQYGAQSCGLLLLWSRER